MRNLKKILALALALTMVLSMMVTASAAFTDADKFDADYAESVEVLTGMEVFQGFPDGSFKPQNTITRAQVAAILYRIDTQDVKDEKADLFAGTAQFSDVGNEWYAGYVGYCANAGYIKGFPDGTFRPDDEVTGIQTLAMILRAIGYDRNGEFSGTQWANEIAKIATKLDILVNVKPGQLSGDASRELVAELLFQAIQQNTVSYSAIRQDYVTNWRDTLGDDFKLLPITRTNDKWGRPYYGWSYEVDGEPESTKFYETPNATFYVETNDCEIAAELDKSKDFKLAYYKNGVLVDAAEEIDVTARKSYRGGQGVILEFYDKEFVEINTYLAEVTDVEEVEYDRKGHLEEYARVEFDAYYAAGTTLEGVVTDDEDFEYEVGDMLLVYANESEVDEGEYTHDEEYTETKWNWTIVDLADSMVGAQSAYTNTATHIIEGEEYPDAEKFVIDETLRTKTIEYTWFFDQFGNLIGAFDIESVYNYGVITSIYWRDSNNGENGYALAEITYMDGTSEKVEVVDIDGYTVEGVEGKNAELFKDVDKDGDDIKIAYVSSTKQYNKELFVNNALYQVESDDGEYTLTKTTELGEDAQVETSVPVIEKGIAHATKSTMFLVWDGEEYITYTGIKNVPDFEKGIYWAAKLDKDTGDITAEYVFINADEQDAAADEADAMFWSEVGERLTEKTHLSKNEPKYYSIKGGLVNGVEGEVLTKSIAIKNEIMDAQGQLLKLNLVDGYVVSVEYIYDVDVEIEAVEADALYLGATADLDISSDNSVMFADGESYYVDEATVIAYNEDTLKRNIKDAQDGDETSYTFVVYTQNTRGVKIAQYIFITECFEAERGVAANALAAYMKAEIAKIDEDKAAYALTDDTTVIDTGWGAGHKTMADLYATWKAQLLTVEFEDVAAIETRLNNQKRNFDNCQGVGVAKLYTNGMKVSSNQAEADAAFENAVAGQTIVLGANVTLPNELTAGITIDAQGKTLTISKGEGDWNRLKSAGSTIVNAVIEGDKIVLDEDITFENCVFEGNLDNSVPAKTTFIDCVFNGTVLFAHGSADVTEVEGSALVATDCVFNKWVKLTDFASVVFTDCEFNGNTGWSNATMQTEVATTFDGCTFNRTGTVLYDVRIGLGQSADMITVKNGTCDIATKSGTNPVVVVTK